MKTHITPTWPAPKNIRAFTTTKHGGISQAEFSSFNLAAHVDDNPEHVKQNREILIKELDLPSEPIWLNQTHSTDVVKITGSRIESGMTDVKLGMTDIKSKTANADASITQTPNTICAILTADCLPLLITNKSGTEVAAIHAGWRGLLNGIITNTIKQMQSNPKDLLVWLGPAISVKHFEINNDIKKNLFNITEILKRDLFIRTITRAIRFSLIYLNSPELIYINSALMKFTVASIAPILTKTFILIEEMEKPPDDKSA